MEQCLFYKLLLKEILSHIECLSVSAQAFISVPQHPPLIAPSCHFSSSHLGTHLHTHTHTFCLPRCAVVQVYAFAGAHHYSNENDHCSSVFIHIQQRAPATICGHVYLSCDQDFFVSFLGCVMLSTHAVSRHMCVWTQGTNKCIHPATHWSLI